MILGYGKKPTIITSEGEGVASIPSFESKFVVARHSELPYDHLKRRHRAYHSPRNVMTTWASEANKGSTQTDLDDLRIQIKNLNERIDDIEKDSNVSA